MGQDHLRIGGSVKRTTGVSFLGLMVLAMTGLNPAYAQILPDNDYDKEDQLSFLSNMDEITFNAVIDDVVAKFLPVIESHGGKLKVMKDWQDSTVNAGASQKGNTWELFFYGGLARRPEVTVDAFQMVVCHELGHHLGGFPFKSQATTNGEPFFAANEGQSDYYASQVCLRTLWASEVAANAQAAATVDPAAQAICDATYSQQGERNLCYRISNAAMPLAMLLKHRGESDPSFSRKDPLVVSKTKDSHPPGQCRLETFVAAANCAASFDLAVIPGRRHADGQGSVAAEFAASRVSCTQVSGYTVGLRPSCWYFARL